MASSAPAGSPRRPLAEAGALVVSYPARLWKAVLALLPSSDSRFLKAVSGLFLVSPSSRWRSQRQSGRRLRESGLPLPLQFHYVESSLVKSEASRALNLIDDIFNRVLSSLHIVRKNLEFWESRAEGSYSQKVYYMIFERGPKALVKETVHLISRRRVEVSSMQHLYRSAASTISEKISVLTSLQGFLASFLAEVYTEVEKYGERSSADLEKSLPSLLMAINASFINLETSIDKCACRAISLSAQMDAIQVPLHLRKFLRLVLRGLSGRKLIFWMQSI